MGSPIKILVCKGKSCRKKGGEELVSVCEKACEKYGVDAKVKEVSCLDHCKKAPYIEMQPGDVSIKHADKAKIKKKLKKAYLPLSPSAM